MLTTSPQDPRPADGMGRPSEPVIVNWDTMTGDRWSALSGLGRTRLVLVELPRRTTVDPMALLAAGARAVVVEDCPPDELAMARAAALAGGSYLSPAVLKGRGTAAGVRRSEGIPGPREVETLRCLVDGMTHRQVARQLGITEQTVSTYAKRLRRKLGAGNAAELTQRAVELGYVAAASQSLPLFRVLPTSAGWHTGAGPVWGTDE